MSEVKFVSWPEIDNIETAKISSRDFQKAHFIEDWVVTEKIDGTNISLNVTREETLFGKRTSLLPKNASFFNVNNNESLVSSVIEKMKNFIEENDDIKQITLYGEYYGNRVLRRIYYGRDYGFLFYGMFLIDNNDTVIWVSFNDFEKFMTSNNLEEYIVPIIGYFKTFEEAYTLKNDEPCFYHDDKHNDKMEGIVIEPRYIPFYNEGKYIFKSKNPEFVEKHSRKKIERFIPSEEFSFLKEGKELFKAYCTESRMYSLFSKEGLPESDKEIGKYIGKFIEDAKKDFLKDYQVYEKIEKKDMKYITNIGNVGYFIYTKVLHDIKG